MEPSKKKMWDFKIIPEQLPQEMVENILMKLPIKACLRFLSVSKEWYRIITQLKTLGKCTLFLLHFSHSINHYALCLGNDGTFQEYARLDWIEGELEKRITKKPVLHCWGNGLVCFSDDKGCVTLWNPSIRRSFLLPRSGRGTPFGVVVDHISNDYKVLRMSYGVDRTTVEIFRLSTGSWELLDCKAPIRRLYCGQVDLKGKSYRIGVDFEDNLILISFDGHTELFGFFKLNVSGLVVDDNRLRSLFLFNESLVFIEKDYNDVNNGQFEFTESMVFIHCADKEDRKWYPKRSQIFRVAYRIWKMEDTEGKSMTLWCTICFDELAMPLGFRENGELLWLVDGKKLISTNLENGSHTRLGYERAYHITVCPFFVESLALWKGPKF